MLYSSEGLMSACGLVPSVFGRRGILLRKRGKSTVLDIWLDFALRMRIPRHPTSPTIPRIFLTILGFFGFLGFVGILVPMRVLLQRVSQASVTVDGTLIASIGRGYLLLLGVLEGDTKEQAEWLAQKIVKLRLFDGDDGKVNDRSVLDIGGEILLVSQFTLAGDVRKGNRPDYTAAARPDIAQPLYEYFLACLRRAGVAKVATGEFGAMMEVALVNDGPITLWMER